MISVVRSVVLSLLVLRLAVFASGNGSSLPAANKYVQYSAKVQQTPWKPGTTGTLLLKLTPQQGIHINTQPPIVVILDDSSSITLVGKPKFGTVKADTSVYLDASKAIRQSFTVARSAAPGPLLLKGTLTYFYCSDAEGWCSRFKQPISVTVTVVK
ncbi:MAG: hypothetical protein HY033_07525 [Ignavibacteriae bacterium]|nr:hypothetical protein [Ignavibacteria bacterium]MBI3364742.1 hypothetical protein [Ignavibacteriota bacterium]